MNQVANTSSIIPVDDQQVDYILLDTSISMSDKWFNLITATNIIIEDIKKSGLNSQMIIHKFSTRNLDNTVQAPAHEMPELFPNSSDVGGYTPLYAAIQLAGLRLRQMAPKVANLLIVTDGEETVHDVEVQVAAAILDWCRALGWQVTFLGCDYNNFRQAKLLGANEDTTIAVATAHLEDAARTYARKRIASWQNGGDITFSKDEQTKFGGYLTNGS